MKGYPLYHLSKSHILMIYPSLLLKPCGIKELGIELGIDSQVAWL
jgi:hypothetical protein